MFIKGTPTTGISGLWPPLHRYEEEGSLTQFQKQRVAIDVSCMLRHSLEGCVAIRSATVAKYFATRFMGGESSDSVDFPSAAVHPHEENALSSENPSSDSRSSLSGAVPSMAALPPMRSVILLDEAHLLSVVKTKMSSIHNCGVYEVCVFDGAELPGKHATHQQRARQRQEAFREGMKKLEELYLLEQRKQESKWWAEVGAAVNMSGAAPNVRVGRVVFPQKHELYRDAIKCFERALHVTPELAISILEPLKERTVECLLAPYDAAAQMAYLCREGYVDAVLSENSELVAYGCPCIITKAHLISRRCKVLRFHEYASHLFRSLASEEALAATVVDGAPDGDLDLSSSTAPPQPPPLTLLEWRSQTDEDMNTWRAVEALRAELLAAVYPTFSSRERYFLRPVMPDHVFPYEVFLLACIVAGCDCAPALPGVTTQQAFQLVARATTLAALFAALQAASGVSGERIAVYRQQVLDAFHCFAQQLVYAPAFGKVCPLNDPPFDWGMQKSSLRLEVLGAWWGPELAQMVCLTHLLNPHNLLPYRRSDWKFPDSAF